MHPCVSGVRWSFSAGDVGTSDADAGVARITGAYAAGTQQVYWAGEGSQELYHVSFEGLTFCTSGDTPQLDPAARLEDPRRMRAATAPEGRTRWGRAALAAAVGLPATGTLAAALHQRAWGLDAELVIQNSSASFSSGRIQAQDVGFAMVPVQQQDGTWRNVLRAGFATADLDGLCVAQVETIPGLGEVTVALEASDDDEGTLELKAADATFDITDLRGDGPGISLQGSTQIGLASTDVTTRPGRAPYESNPLGAPEAFVPGLTAGSASANAGHTNGQGWTGIDATAGNLDNVHGTLWQAQVIGPIDVPGLEITVRPGNVDLCGS